MDVLTEISELRAQRAALAAGEPWQESRAGSLDGKALSAEALEAAVTAGQVHRCRTCSSPHQAVFHE